MTTPEIEQDDNNRAHKKLAWSYHFVTTGCIFYFKHPVAFVFQIVCIYPILSQL